MTERRAHINLTLALDVTAPGDLAVCLAARAPNLTESLAARSRAVEALPMREVQDDTARTHLVAAPTGELTMSYRADSDIGPVSATALDDRESIVFRRPSRYCPSDRLAGLAAAEFSGLDPGSAVFAVEQWIHDTVDYVPGVSDPVDDALHPLLARTGVCRDFAHLGVAMCRALGIPARYTAVYASGLDPMDFHAVFEAAVEEHWYVFDATRLAPRSALVRIASGRDAADVALVTPIGAVLQSVSHQLVVTSDPDLPTDDPQSLVALA